MKSWGGIVFLGMAFYGLSVLSESAWAFGAHRVPPPPPAGYEMVSTAEFYAMLADGRLALVADFSEATPSPAPSTPAATARAVSPSIAAENPSSIPFILRRIRDNTGRWRQFVYRRKGKHHKDPGNTTILDAGDLEPGTGVFPRLSSTAVSAAATGPWARLEPVACGQEIGAGRGSDMYFVSMLRTDDEHGFDPESIHAKLDWPLKRATPCVRDQGARGTCSAFATNAAIETIIAHKYGKWINLSEQAIYNQALMVWESGDNEDGYFPNEYLDHSIQQSYAFPFEREWDYNPSLWRSLEEKQFKKSCVAYSEFCSDTAYQGKPICTAAAPGLLQCGYASQITVASSGPRATHYASIWDPQNQKASFETLRKYLRAGRPVIFDFEATDQFEATPTSGFVPDSAEAKEQGGHAVELVAYISNEELAAALPLAPPATGGGYYVAKNSWGTSHGDHGYAYFPQSFLARHTDGLFVVQNVEYTAAPPEKRVDQNTRCEEDSLMRCCPSGFGLYGYQRESDLLLCAGIPERTTSGSCYVDRSSRRDQLRACAPGFYLAGFSRDGAALKCCKDKGSPRQTYEFVAEGHTPGLDALEVYPGNWARVCTTTAGTLVTGVDLESQRLLCL